VIAATNHEELLDSAIWRRFSYRLALNFPSQDQRQLMWAQFLSPLQFQEREIELLVDLSDGFSGSDLREVCLRLQRRRIASQKAPELKDAFQVLQNMAIGEGAERRFLAGLRSKDEHAISTLLRQRNARLYSYSAIADLLGISKATAFRRAKGVA
jgi:SpoVK/Ycf46/Vps4 family AAA+-type ATPase